MASRVPFDPEVCSVIKWQVARPVECFTCCVQSLMLLCEKEGAPGDGGLLASDGEFFLVAKLTPEC